MEFAHFGSLGSLGLTGFAGLIGFVGFIVLGEALGWVSDQGFEGLGPGCVQGD